MHALLILALSFCAPKDAPVVPKDTLQLVVGIAPSWDSSKATLYRFERKRPGSAWKRVGKAWPARTGKRGLAAGRGLIEWCGPDDERKVENDKKAPAGAFYLGDIYGFGEGLRKAPRGKMRKLSKTMACVSDPESEHYNRIVDTEDFDRDDLGWTRPLRRKDGIKSRTIVVGHNGMHDPENDPPVAGHGSCILFHLERKGRATVGCTSLTEKRLDALIAWLKPKAEPVYVLMTREQYDALQELDGSGLPELP